MQNVKYFTTFALFEKYDQVRCAHLKSQKLDKRSVKLVSKNVFLLTFSKKSVNCMRY